MSFGTSSAGKTMSPEFFKTPFDYKTPGQDVIGELSRMIGQGTGDNFGSRNMFGSGPMKDVFAEKLSQAAIGKTQLVPQGQWIQPGQGQGTQQSFGVK